MLSRPGSHSFGTVRLETRSSALRNENSVANVKSLNSNNTKTPGTSKRRAFGDISNRKPLQPTGGKSAQTSKKAVSFQVHTPSVRGLSTAPRTNVQPLKSSAKKVDFVLPQRTAAVTTPRVKSQISRSTTRVPSVESVELKAGTSYDPLEGGSDNETAISLQEEIDHSIKLYRQFEDGTVERKRVQNHFKELDAEFENSMSSMLAQADHEDFMSSDDEFVNPIEDLSLELEGSFKCISFADDISI